MDTHPERNNVLSLCSGTGMLDLGYKLSRGTARTVCYVEIEVFVQQVLVARIEDELLDDAPIFSNLKTFDGEPWRGVVDTIIGGFPCQPFSVAGKGRGTEDPRHLWPYIAKLIGVINPKECFFENVPGLVSTTTPDGRHAIDIVKEDLERLGYRVEIGLFSAEEVGAPHKRLRVFILAHRNGSRELQQEGDIGDQRERSVNDSRDVENPEQSGTRSERREIGRGVGSSDVRQGNGKIGASGIDATSREVENTRREFRSEGIEVSGELRGQFAERDSCSEFDGSGEALVNTEGLVRERGIGERNTAWRPQEETRDPINNLDDSYNAGLEGHRSDVQCTHQLPTWPPSPTSRSEWEYVLRERPELAPAVADSDFNGYRRVGRSVESEARNPQEQDDGWFPDDTCQNVGQEQECETEPPIRGMADGVDSGMDESPFAHRQDRLRAVGNGVVTLTVALAHSVLSRRMTK